MAVLAIPLLEAAGAALAEAFPALLGGAATAAILSLPGDHAEDKTRTQPIARAMPKTDEQCKKCPPDTGAIVRRNHSMKPQPRAYQGRVTGFPYDVEASRWSMEWDWLDTDFDGFKSGGCLLQEAKGNYDQFLALLSQI